MAAPTNCPYDPTHGALETKLLASEKMFGRGGEFEYLACPVCGSIRLANIPEDLGSYYPDDYYSFDTGAADPGQSRLFTTATKLLLGVPALARRLGRGRFSRKFVPVALGWFAGHGIKQDARILDVGSGSGAVLSRLQTLGFTDLRGIDPFLPVERRQLGPVEIRRMGLGEVTDPADVIIFHHVLEHVVDPVAELALARDALAPGGQILVLLPLVDSDAAERYGADWVQLDAPRHLTIPTEQGMRAAAASLGLEVVEHWRTGTALQFWASEQYRQGISLHDERSWHRSPERSPWSKREIAAWDAEARRLNARGRGDEGAFVLRRRAAA